MSLRTRRPQLPAIALSATAAVAFAAADVLNPAYDPIAETASRYVNGTAGWLIPTALVAMAAAALALRRLLRAAGRRGVALLVFAAGVVVAAVFPADPPGQYHRPSTSELVHGLGGWSAFIALPVAALLLSRTIAVRRVRIAAWSTVAATTVFAVFLVDVMGGPSMRVGGSESLVGLTERLALAADLVWIALAAVAVGRTRRGVDADETAHPGVEPAAAAIGVRSCAADDADDVALPGTEPSSATAVPSRAADDAAAAILPGTGTDPAAAAAVSSRDANDVVEAAGRRPGAEQG